MEQQESDRIPRRIVDAAIAAALLHPLAGFVVHRLALKLIPGLTASPGTLAGAFAAAWLAMFLAYLRWDARGR